ncbi:hypothetical protein AQUCO_00400284v1 [Aquilegia coerulea]|uniref:Reverse transcriptase zinc-binding domain-containing protein n=1 Tax=Aquilegia coerulea TaxID=218851 RepID=A0A2G5EU60_AQUCA|nr:hypothetical protein AQUCO_00400284v1 [Aquilegia coerulea]
MPADCRIDLHLLKQCSQSRILWREIIDGVIDIEEFLDGCSSIQELLEKWPKFPTLGLGAKLWKFIPFAVMWIIWLHRNRIVFDLKTLDLNRAAKIKATLWYWADGHLQRLSIR